MPPLHRLNLVSLLCHWAFGPGHHWCLRYLAGIVIMVVGVLVAKIGGTIHAYHFHYFADVLGYGIHGLGAVPFIEWVIHLFQEKNEEGMEWPPLSNDGDEND